MKANISQTIHAGTNYSLQKDRDYIWTATSRHSDLTSVGIPKNVLIVGAGEGQGIELSTDCNDVENPNEKKKYNTKVYVGKFATGVPGGSFAPINDSASYAYAVKGAFKLPFDVFSGSVASGYNSAINAGYRSDAIVTNMHSDTTDFSNDIPMQGPFTQQWVGGHQSRHIDLNRYDETLIDGETLSAPPNNIHNLYTRPEAWRFLVVESGGSSDGALGLADAQYGVTAVPGHPNLGNYPDVAKKAATLYRDLRTKRPVNVANIQTTTSSVNHGNYSKTFEIISVAGGVKENNLYFRDNSDQSNYLPQSIIDALPETTNPMTLIAQTPYLSGNIFGTYGTNRQPDGESIPYDTFASGSFTISGTSGIFDRDTMSIGSPNIVLEFDNDASVTPGNIAIDFTGTDTRMWDDMVTAIQTSTFDTVSYVDNGNQTATFSLTSSVGGAGQNGTIQKSVPGGSYIDIHDSGSGGGIAYIIVKDITIPRITSSVSEMVFTTRFSAPGGIEAQSYGYLDAYSHEYSVHNNLNYRNLTVRGTSVRASASVDGSEFYNFGGSGEADTIRMDNQLNQRDSHKALLSRHCGKYGVDTRNTSYSVVTDPLTTEVDFQTAVNKPSFNKQQRNENRRPSDTSTVLSPVLITRHDNGYINSPIPRSDFQYKWVTSSLGDSYSITSGKQRMYGYAHPTGILSSSVEIDGDSGFVPAITFPTASEIFGV